MFLYNKLFHFAMASANYIADSAGNMDNNEEEVNKSMNKEECRFMIRV